MDPSRYHRQMLLPGIGEAGQRRLGEASVLIVGVGALGSVSAEALCRAGVGAAGGRLVIADRDVVETTNLQRQTLFDEADATAGTPKVEAAQRRLWAINAGVSVEAHAVDVDHRNAEALAGVGPDAAGLRVDAVVDGTDNFATRLLLNDLCVKHAIPYLYGGAVGTTGSAMAILPCTAGRAAPWEAYRDEAGEPHDFATPDLAALLPEPPPPGQGPTCDTAGVLGPAVGMVAHFQTAQCLKVLLGHWHNVEQRMLQLDLWRNKLRLVDVSAFRHEIDPATREFPHLDGRFAERVTSLCGRDAVQIARRDTPRSPRDDDPSAGSIDFDALADRLAAHGPVRRSPLMLRALVTEGSQRYELSVFPDGRAIVRGTTDPARARSVYARYVGV